MQLNEDILSTITTFIRVPVGKTFWAPIDKGKASLFVKLDCDYERGNITGYIVDCIDDLDTYADNVPYNVFDIRNNILCYLPPETEVIIVNGMFCFDE